jgi:hypothetical protein
MKIVAGCKFYKRKLASGFTRVKIMLIGTKMKPIFIIFVKELMNILFIAQLVRKVKFQRIEI